MEAVRINVGTIFSVHFSIINLNHGYLLCVINIMRYSPIFMSVIYAVRKTIRFHSKKSKFLCIVSIFFENKIISFLEMEFNSRVFLLKLVFQQHLTRYG